VPEYLLQNKISKDLTNRNKYEQKSKKVGKVMREFKKGQLHSGKSGKIVKNPKQAIAIALSESGN
jgi:hypothetical protein